MLQLPQGKKIMVDIVNAASDDEHQYDLPFQYSGQFINASFKYTPNTKKQETLGTTNGYQFIWKEAEAAVKDTTIQLTLLNNNTYYTISSLVEGTAQVFFTRSGAGDPNYNLRREPAFIIRKQGKGQAFVSVLEIHGRYDPINEFSTNAYPSVKKISMLKNDAAFTVAEIVIDGKKLLIVQCNNDFEKKATHSFQYEMGLINFTGPFAVIYNGTNLNNDKLQ